MKNLNSVCLAATVVAFIGVAHGAAAQGLASGVIECREIRDDSDRLACFDALASGFSADDVMADASLNKAEAAPPQPVLTPEERFGAADLPKTASEKREEEDIKSLTASVVDIGRNGRGKYVVVLANGQVWRQLSADTTKLRIPKSGAEGMSAEIKRRMLGAHSLYLNGENRGIRVERIK